MTHIRTATTPGSPTRLNEDFTAVTDTAAVLLDGAGGPASLNSGCSHGTPWFVRRLGAHLLHSMLTSDQKLPDLLAQAITDVAAAHTGCDLRHHGTPSTTVVLLRRAAPGIWEYLVLSDSTLVLVTDQAVQTISDKRIDDVATVEKQRMESHPLGSKEHHRARLAKVNRERDWRNREGGHWTAASDSDVAAHAITGTVDHLQRAVLLTDGAERWMHFTDRTIKELLAALDEQGPAAIIAQVRAHEDADPKGQTLPRAKHRDDATIVDIHLQGASR
nr:protein phosphatase 2C domain-containing protein [Nocardiopsis sp. JB363]